MHAEIISYSSIRRIPAMAVMLLCFSAPLFAQAPAIPMPPATPPAALPATPPSGIPPGGVPRPPLPPAPATNPGVEVLELPTSPVVRAEPKAVAEVIEEEDTGPVLKSLFFTQEEMALIMQAARAYERFKIATSNNAQSQAKDFLSQLEEAKKTAQFEKTFEYPQFFLESLMYHTPDDWFIQVNGQKLSPEKREKFSLKVLAVDGEKALFEWKPMNMQQVNDTWAKTQSEDVTVNRKAGTVTFVLHSNQTFSSYLMRVLEGKVKPVRLDNENNMNDNASKPKKLLNAISGVSTPPH